MAKEFMTMDEYASSLVGNVAPTMKKKGMAKGGKVQKMAKGGPAKKKGYAKGGKVQKMANGGMMKKKGMAKGGKV
jgi:hypothetical protein